MARGKDFGVSFSAAGGRSVKNFAFEIKVDFKFVKYIYVNGIF